MKKTQITQTIIHHSWTRYLVFIQGRLYIKCVTKFHAGKVSIVGCRLF